MERLKDGMWCGDGERPLQRAYAAEECEDMRDDMIKFVEHAAGASEVGVPMAYFEITEPVDIKDPLMPLPAVHRIVYKTFAYRIDLPGTKVTFAEVFSALIADIEGMRDGRKGVLVWRMNEKVTMAHDYCQRCGGMLVIRTRVAFVPDDLAALRGRLAYPG